MEISLTATVAIGVATVSVGIASAVIGGVTVAWKISSRFVTIDRCSHHISECGKLRESKRETSDQCINTVARELNQLRESMESKHREQKKSSQVQYYMLRSLIAHSKDLTPELRAKILNAGNGGGSENRD